MLRTPLRSRTAAVADNLKLTPKQLQKKLEVENRLKEKQKAKEDRDKKLQEEKEQRQKEREEKERQRKKERDDKEELRKKEKEEKEEQRRKEKEDRDRKKQAEIDAKNEDRKKKEEQKEEERRKKEDEKNAKEEAEIKKKEAIKQAFTKFFVQPKGLNKKTENCINENYEPVQCNFMPFRIKEGMKMAPLVRSTFTDKRKSAMEKIVCDNKKEISKTELYLKQLPNLVHGKAGKTWPNDDNDIFILGKCHFNQNC